MDNIKFKQILKSIIWGLLLGTICLGILFVILSLMIVYTSLSISFIPQIVTVCGGLSGFASGYISSRIFGHKGLLIGLLCGIIMSAVITIATLAMSGIMFSGGELTKIIIILIASAIGGAFGVNSNSYVKKP